MGYRPDDRLDLTGEESRLHATRVPLRLRKGAVRPWVGPGRLESGTLT